MTLAQKPPKILYRGKSRPCSGQGLGPSLSSCSYLISICTVWLGYNKEFYLFYVFYFIYMIWPHVLPDLTAFAFPKAPLQLPWPPGYSPTPDSGFFSCCFFWWTLLTQTSTWFTPSSPFFIQMWGLSQNSYCSLPPPQHPLPQFPSFVFSITHIIIHLDAYLILLNFLVYCLTVY